MRTFKNRRERVDYVTQELYDLLEVESEELIPISGPWTATETDRAEFRSTVMHKLQQMFAANKNKGDRS